MARMQFNRKTACFFPNASLTPTLNQRIFSRMIFALALFVASDICASVILRRHAIQNPHSLATAITSYLYNTATAGLYLHLIEHRSFFDFHRHRRDLYEFPRFDFLFINIHGSLPLLGVFRKC